MTQDEIDKSEWENPANWTRFGFYRSDRDSRLWVPKRPSRFERGQAINLAKPGAKTFFLGVAIMPCVILLTVVLILMLRP